MIKVGAVAALSIARPATVDVVQFLCSHLGETLNSRCTRVAISVLRSTTSIFAVSMSWSSTSTAFNRGTFSGVRAGVLSQPSASAGWAFLWHQMRRCTDGTPACALSGATTTTRHELRQHAILIISRHVHSSIMFQGQE